MRFETTPIVADITESRKGEIGREREGRNGGRTHPGCAARLGELHSNLNRIERLACKLLGQ